MTHKTKRILAGVGAVSLIVGLSLALSPTVETLIVLVSIVALVAYVITLVFLIMYAIDYI